jgi:ABC-type sugar transport system ATPase subunit
MYDNSLQLVWKKIRTPLGLSKGKGKKLVQGQIDRFSIKSAGQGQRVGDLSGGNQQKVLLARLMLTEPEILIMDEPTKGIDVGSKYEIYLDMVKLAEAGKSIIMISSEMPEILGMSDRIMVMHEGTVAAILDRSEATQELILNYASGLAGETAV